MEAVAIHVRDGEAIAVVVVDGLVCAGGVIHRPVPEGDAALLDAVDEPEVAEDVELVRSGKLVRPAIVEPRRGERLRGICVHAILDGRALDGGVLAARRPRQLRRVVRLDHPVPARGRREEQQRGKAAGEKYPGNPQSRVCGGMPTPVHFFSIPLLREQGESTSEREDKQTVARHR